MLVLSVGMPRAGSGWHYNLIHDLVVAGGGQDARQVRRRFCLQRWLTQVNCNVGALTPQRLLPVMAPTLAGYTYAIKVHAAPTPLALRLIRRGAIRPTYIYRDPRAALLSAWEYGSRGIERGRPNAFSQLTDFRAALKFMLFYMQVWETWMACESALKVRYEDLLVNYPGETAQLVDFLGIDPHSAAVQAVINGYHPQQTRRDQHGLHFAHGQVERFRTVLTLEQLAACNQAFGPQLERMGYSL
jgi:hypothetical protein